MSVEIQINNAAFRPVDAYKEAWELIKPNYWILFAICLVGIMIGGASMYIVLGAMIAGINICLLAAIQGKEPKIEWLIKGFSFFGSSLIVVIAMVLPMLIVFGLFYGPLLFATVMGARMSQDEAFALIAGVIVIEMILAFVMVCFHTLVMFSFHLIVDKRLSGIQAMKVSAKGVWRNLGPVAGLWAVGILVSIVASLLLCIGNYFAIPIMLAAHTVAYRKIFPGEFDPETI